jgi:chaperonin GroES|tara:strand:+ start:1724 stop:2041 length:318 start_codon:yes stop_codon:yes gene_type:complete
MENKVMFNPIGEKIIVKSLSSNEQTEGGVILPDIAQEDSTRGVVVAVGPGAVMIDGSRCDMQTKVGDIVVYPKFGAKKLEYKGDEYLILKEIDILTILTEEKNDE